MRDTLILGATLLLAILMVGGCGNPWTASGILYVEQSSWNKAEACFWRALEESPNDPRAHFNLGFTLGKLAERHIAASEMDSAAHKYGLATEHYLRSAELDSAQFTEEADLNIRSNYATAFNKARELVTSQRRFEAMEYFDLAYAANPRGEAGYNARLPRIQLALQTAQDEGGNEELVNEAIALIDDTLANATETAQKVDLLETKASALQMLGRESDAENIYEQLVAEDPRNVAMLQNLGDAFSSKSNFAKAAELYQRAVDVVESDPDAEREDRALAVLLLAQALQRNQDFEKAIPVLERAIELTNDDPDNNQLALLYLAQANYQLERWDEAIAASRQLTEIDEENVDAWQILYISLNRSGQTDEAIEARQRYLELKDQQGR